MEARDVMAANAKWVTGLADEWTLVPAFVDEGVAATRLESDGNGAHFLVGNRDIPRRVGATRFAEVMVVTRPFDCLGKTIHDRTKYANCNAVNMPFVKMSAICNSVVI